LIEEPIALKDFLTSKYFHDGGWELFHGELVAMSPARGAHEYMIQRLGHLLQDLFERERCGCVVFGSNIRLQLNEEDVFFMPDLSVSCNERDVTNVFFSKVPDLVVEVTSKTTKKYDFVDKLKIYRTHGAIEYWVIDLDNKEMTVFDFKNNRDRVFALHDDIQSEFLPGFKYKLREILGLLYTLD
jgi:Uma2 family endonuclease